MHRISQPLRAALAVTLLALLGACKGGGEGGDPTGVLWSMAHFGADESSHNRYPASPSSPFDLFATLAYDMADVLAERTSPGIAKQRFTGTIRIGSPELDDRPITSRASEAIRLDYARSLGLTGAGQVLSMVDDAVRQTHEQFGGKTVTTSSPGAYGTGDDHGTAVAALMTGTGGTNEIEGVAPGASLHAGLIEYGAELDFDVLAGYLDRAASLNAIAQNNSWNFVKSDDTTLMAIDRPLATYFSDSGALGTYIQSLRDFQNGVGGSGRGGVVVWAVQNDYGDSSVSIMNALPLVHPELESGWLAVIDAIPVFNEDGIQGAYRASGKCNEAARYCIAADGLVRIATADSNTSYGTGIGTSYAAPQVAGAIAVLAEAFPTLSAKQLRDRLLVTADNAWFTTTGAVTFAPGLTHGYSEVWGHGFVDLRAALLPIGQVYTPAASGEKLLLGSAAVVSGNASGDAIANSLARASMVTFDGMGGSFATRASAVVGSVRRLDTSSRALADMMHGSFRDRRLRRASAVGTGGDSAALLQQGRAPELTSISYAVDSMEIGLLQGEGVSISAIVPRGNSGATGIALGRTLDLGGPALKLGLRAMQQTDSMLGITAPGAEGGMVANLVAAEVALAAPLTRYASLRVGAEFGVASGPGAGIIDGFRNVSYDSLGVSLDTASVLKRGDSLTLFARQPMAITTGAADMTFATRQSATGEVQYSSLDVDLSPAARQTDIGFEYLVPLSLRTDLALGLTRSFNLQNVEGRQDTVGVVAVQMRF